MSSEPRIVDLSHPVTNGMRAYAGVPQATISAFLTHGESRTRYQDQCELTFSHVDIVAGVGTYLDSPYHRDPTLPDFAGIPLARVVNIPGLVVDLPQCRARAIVPDDLANIELKGKALVLRTGMEAFWETDTYWNESPYLLAETAALLVTEAIALLLVDFLNVDDTSDMRRPAHTSLLKAQIPIVENACGLDQLPRSGFRVHAPPVALKGVASFPTRVYAVVD
jgi:kynurenine formamidase